MRQSSTAIIHLREPTAPLVRRAIRRMIKAARGVSRIEFRARDAVLAVRFDHDQTALAEIVRIIEDTGTSVVGVAQRL